MRKLGDLSLTSGRPLVAVSFTDADGRDEVAEARHAGVAIAELRIDLFARLTPDYVVRQAERLAGLPMLATIRLASEGGAWSGDEAARITLFRAVLPHVDGIDIELQSSDAIAALQPAIREAGKLLVISHHDLRSTPPYDVLAAICVRAAEAGADIIKIAAMVHSEQDIASLARLLVELPARNLVVIGMGEKGLATRIAFPAKGSLFTFAAKGDRVSAPGQIAYPEMLRRLSVSEVSGKTS
ncbi:MAG: type I 3-dehydroquinate dehydratase [Alphaproteobacteria bacterium]